MDGFYFLDQLWTVMVPKCLDQIDEKMCVMAGTSKERFHRILEPIGRILYEDVGISWWQDSKLRMPKKWH